MSFLPRDNRMVFTNDNLNKKIHPEKSLFGREKMWKSTVLFDASKYFSLVLRTTIAFQSGKVKNFALSLQKK